MSPFRLVPHRRFFSTAAALLSLTLLLAPSLVRAQRPNAYNSTMHWVGTWGTAVGSTANNVFGSPYRGTNAYSEQTLRLIIHTSIPGGAVRIRLSNAFGTQAISVGAAHIAVRDSAANIVAGTDRLLNFGGQPSLTLPPGADTLSDPICFSVPQTGDLAISLYLPGNQTVDTAHGEAHQTSYVSASGGGDATGTVTFPLDAAAPTTTQWPLLTGVEVYVPTSTPGLVTFGDSITDGTGEPTDSNQRWPDFLFQRLIANGQTIGITNKGIGGNRVLDDIAGPSGEARFERDVLIPPSARWVTVLLGINDLGFNPVVVPADIIAGQRQFVARAHAQGLKIYGCTLTPAGSSVTHGGASNSAKRQQINAFIRSGAYDAVIDFDAATRDPANADNLNPAYDSGDGLHPNAAGYQVMANAVNLSLFQ